MAKPMKRITLFENRVKATIVFDCTYYKEYLEFECTFLKQSLCL